MQKELFALLAEPFTGESLFDCFADMVFFIKNQQAQYVVVNQTLVERCGMKDKAAIIGRTSDEVFPDPLGSQYRSQDEQALATGKPILNQLELHLYPSQGTGWCLTNKVPLYDRNGEVVGVAGMSKDLCSPSEKDEEYSQIAATVTYIQANYHQSLKVDQLAERAGLSTYQFERRLRKIFQLTAGQFIQKTRMDAAVTKLRKTDASIAAIAVDCGYSDQSAFSRQFKQTVGLSPGQFRRMTRDKSL